MPVSELLGKSILELASLIRLGELTASELVEASLRRIDELEPAINAFTHVATESALASAAAIRRSDERPFAGVPIAIKDNRAVAGMPITMGSDLFGDHVVGHDAFLVRRLKEAGFVIVGKTVLPEMGILPTTEPRRFGAVRNPWALDRTPGGSSGGAAAAVAAGMVPVAHGNDGGGSIRIPAACCGLVGLKAARGRISVGPDGGHSFFVSDGVLTRTVDETASLLDVLAGYEPGDAAWAPSPDEPFAHLAARNPARLRIGLVLEPAIDDASLDPAGEVAARDCATLLASAGHEVEEIAAPWSGLGLLSEFTRAYGPSISLTTMIGGRIAGRDPTEEDVEPLTWELWVRAREHDALSLLSVQSRLESLARKIVVALAPFNAIVTPALAQRPLPIGTVHGRGPDPWDHFQRSGRFTPYTAIANLTGLPAIALPLYHGDDGLPLAVQLIGRPAGEGELLALSRQLEQALPWSQRQPGKVE